jgi:hypothetical protein
MTRWERLNKNLGRLVGWVLCAFMGAFLLYGVALLLFAGLFAVAMALIGNL